MKILHFISNVLNLIYPNVCGICDKLCNKDICKKCELKLNNIAKIKIDTYKNKNFKKHLYKFREKVYIYKGITKFIIKNKKICGFLKNYDIIIPVPIHNKRKLERGYNQSALLAQEIAKSFINIKYVDDVLFKKINNKPQSTKNKKDRKTNVIGAYYLKNKEILENKKILLLDDIYTTGNTVNECCKVLKQANVKVVDVITIAKD